MRAPIHPHVVQGPTDPDNLYAVVTWDPADNDADRVVTGWAVYRDGVQIGTTTDGGGRNDWDKRALTDDTVVAGETYSYQVRPVAGSTQGPVSRNADILIRASPPEKTFDITDYAEATVRDQIAAALVDARAADATYAEPAAILLPAGTHTLGNVESSGGTFINDHNIILRGASRDTTIVRAGWAGSTVESGLNSILFKWGGSTTAVSGLNPSRRVERGDLFVELESVSSFQVGDFIYLNEIGGALATANDLTDNYDAWDCNVIEEIRGTLVRVRYPWAKPFTTAAIVGKLSITGCGIEQMTLQGQADDEQTYYTLLQAEHVALHHFAECRFRWFNRNAVYRRGYKTSIVNCLFTECDPRPDAGESFRYIVTEGRGMGHSFIGNTMGDLDRVSSSMLTTQVSHKQVVRHNRFLRSINYGYNGHGAADYWSVVENNYFLMPEAAKGALFFGNSSFVYDGPGRVKGNTIDQAATACVAFQQNSYGILVHDNWYVDPVDDLVNWYGADLPNMAAGEEGNARLSFRRNQLHYSGAPKANRGYIIGQPISPTPTPGAYNVILADNEIDVDANAIVIGGSAALSHHLQVSGNTGLNDYTRPALVASDYWAGNQDSGADLVNAGTDGSPYFADTFGGVAGASAGWPVYLRSGAAGIGSDFTVSASGNYGRLSATSATTGGRKIATALRLDTVHDSVQLCDLRNITTTTSRRQAIVARHQGGTAGNDRYQVVYEYNAANNKLRLEKVIGGVATILAQTTAFDTLTADLRIRLTVAGSALAVRAWFTSGSEPGSDTLAATDSAITELGKVGVLLDAPDAQTTSADFDNYKLVNWTRHAQDDYGLPYPVEWEPLMFPWEAYDGIINQDAPAAAGPVIDKTPGPEILVPCDNDPLSITIKRGDTIPRLRRTLTYCDDKDGDAEKPMDLTLASSVYFTMRDASDEVMVGSPKIHAMAAIIDAPNGVVEYPWSGSDTDTASGDDPYRGEFEVNWVDGGVETWPRTGYIEITIPKDLDPGVTP